MPLTSKAGSRPRRSDYEPIDNEESPSGCCMCWSKYFGCLGNLQCFRKAEIPKPEAIHDPEPTTQQPITQPPTRQQSLSQSPTLQEPLLTPPTRQRPPLQPPTRREQIPTPPTGQQPPMNPSNREQCLPKLPIQQETIPKKEIDSLYSNLRENLKRRMTLRFPASREASYFLPQRPIREENTNETLRGVGLQAFLNEYLSERSAGSPSRDEASVLGDGLSYTLMPGSLSPREPMNRRMLPIFQWSPMEPMQGPEFRRQFLLHRRLEDQPCVSSLSDSRRSLPWRRPTRQEGIDGPNWYGLHRRESQREPSEQIFPMRRASDLEFLPSLHISSEIPMRRASDLELLPSLHISPDRRIQQLLRHFTPLATQQDNRSQFVSTWGSSTQDVLNNSNREETSRRDSQYDLSRIVTAWESERHYRLNNSNRKEEALREFLRQPLSNSSIRQESLIEREPKQETLRKSPRESSPRQDTMKRSMEKVVEFENTSSELKNSVTRCDPAKKLPNLEELQYGPPIRQEPLSVFLTKPAPTRRIQESLTQSQPLDRKEPMQDSMTQQRSPSDPLIQDGFSDLRHIPTQQELISELENQRELQRDTPIRQEPLSESLTRPAPTSNSKLDKKLSEWIQESLTRSQPLDRKMQDSMTQQRSPSDPFIQDGFSDLRHILTQQELDNPRELQQDTQIRPMSLPEPLHIPNHPVWGSTFRRENLLRQERRLRSLPELSILQEISRDFDLRRRD